jgi:pimeloyl-ACP methyl ester carboxylesterase
MRQPVTRLLVLLVITATAARAEDNPLDKAPSRFAKLNDLKVHYKSLGMKDTAAKTALVFVHGWCCDLTVWRDQAAEFDGKVPMLFIDLPGYGQSDHPRIDYTMDLFAKGIDAVLQDAGVEHAVLVGHSMGTPVVRHFYRLYPDKTKALIFVDGALRMMIDPAQAERFLAMFKEETFKQDAPNFLMRMLPESTPQATRDRIQAMITNTSPQAAISSMRSMMSTKPGADEEPIKVPAQALMAPSPYWTDDYKQFVRKIAPDIDYREFEGVSHFLFMDKPKEFNAAMAEFLKKQGVMKL